MPSPNPSDEYAGYVHALLYALVDYARNSNQPMPELPRDVQAVDIYNLLIEQYRILQANDRGHRMHMAQYLGHVLLQIYELAPPALVANTADPVSIERLANAKAILQQVYEVFAALLSTPTDRQLTIALAGTSRYEACTLQLRGFLETQDEYGQQLARLEYSAFGRRIKKWLFGEAVEPVFRPNLSKVMQGIGTCIEQCSQQIRTRVVQPPQVRTLYDALVASGSAPALPPQNAVASLPTRTPAFTRLTL